MTSLSTQTVCLSLLVSALCLPARARAQGAAEGLPSSTVSFFNAQGCPQGWEPLLQAHGRTIVPSMTGATIGGTAGTPLEGTTEPKHTHTIASSITTDTLSYIGIAGEANHSVAATGKKSFSTDSGESSPGLPYVLLMVCSKVTEGNPKLALPKGMTIFYAGDQSCPAGWSQLYTTQGRFVVALPQGGTVGVSFGGRSLNNLEVREHTHLFSGSVSTTSQGVGLGSGCCADGYAKNGTYPYNGVSGSGAVNMPYIHLLQCQKD